MLVHQFRQAHGQHHVAFAAQAAKSTGLVAVAPIGEAGKHFIGQIKHGADGARHLQGGKADRGKFKNMQPRAQAVQAVHALFLFLVDAQDVLAVNGRDKRLGKRPDDLAVQQVGLFFQKGDFLVHVIHVGNVFQHVYQQGGHAA